MLRAALAIAVSSIALSSAWGAPPTPLPSRVEVTIRRPGDKALFVQLELLSGKAKTRILGCQTGQRDKRCTRKRTEVPLRAGQLAQLQRLWSDFVNRPPCRHRPGPTNWGRIWVERKGHEFSGPMVPTRAHASLKDDCYRHARLGWWLLDRYDRRK